MILTNNSYLTNFYKWNLGMNGAKGDSGSKVIYSCILN